jgi:hypothetical protein
MQTLAILPENEFPLVIVVLVLSSPPIFTTLNAILASVLEY